MATQRKCTQIPRANGWILPFQSLATGVAVYATVYVFHVSSKPFIVVVVAAALQLLFGIYCCITANRPGIHHRFVLPAFFIAAAGVWCGVLYYFSLAVSSYMKIQPPPGSSIANNATWSYVGLGVSVLNIILNIALLVIFVVSGTRQTSYPQPQNAYISPPVYNMPPVAAQFQHQPQQPQYAMNGANPGYQNTYAPTQTTFDSKPSQGTMTTATPMSELASPVAAPAMQQPPYYPYDRSNRIDVIRRLIALQSHDGHWEYSPELADLVRQWGGRDLAASGEAHGVTALSQACLTELCGYVWAAQRDGATEARLSPAELVSLQMIHWDLRWAQTALDKATAWLGGFR